MPLSHVEHFPLKPEHIESTEDWYVKVPRLKVGPCPDFKFPVCRAPISAIAMFSTSPPVAET